MTDPNTAAAETDTSLAEMQAMLQTQRDAVRAEMPVGLDARLDRLDRAIALLRKYEERFVAAMDDDFGHRSADQSRLTDIASSIGALQHSRKHAAGWMKPEKRKVGPFPLNLLGAKARIEFQPLGVIGVISPWNFPVNLTFSPLAGILSAGNRAMIKPSEFTPATSAAMKEAIAEYFDSAEIAVVTGGPQTGSDFSGLAFDHLLFTGATSVGRHVMRAASENLVPVTLELGGKSPVIIGRSAVIPSTVDAIVTGKLMNAGQICLAPDYVMVPEERLEDFVSATEQSVARMYPTLLDNDDYTSVINRRHFERITAYIDEAKERGNRVVEINPAGEDFSQQPHNKIAPTLVINPDDDLQVMQDEIFGPVMPVKSYKDVNDAIDFVNDRPRPLGLYAFGQDKQEHDHILSRTVSGGVTVNDVVMHVAQEDLPFGGVGPSGTGAYHGVDGFRTFSHAKSVFTASRIDVAELAGLRPPYGSKTRKAIRQQIDG